MRGGDSANSTNDAMHWFARSQQLTTRIPIIIICMTICLVQCDDDNAQMHRCSTPTVYSCELALTQPNLLTEIKFNLTLNGINIIAAFYMWLMHELLRARSKCGRVLRAAWQTKEFELIWDARHNETATNIFLFTFSINRAALKLKNSIQSEFHLFRPHANF